MEGQRSVQAEGVPVKPMIMIGKPPRRRPMGMAKTQASITNRVSHSIVEAGFIGARTQIRLIEPM